MSASILSPKLVEYCRNCPAEEQRVALAYCAYLTFADRQLRRMEAKFTRALAEEIGADEKLLAEYARKARRRKLKIKMPPSAEGRLLLFHP